MARIVSDICAGLHEAHTARATTGERLGIVHRDVSPQNILVSRQGVAKLLDFGVAKANGRLTQTQSGTLKGKLRYMAPEQLNGVVDQRTDVFAAGVCLFEATLGRNPYGDDDLDDIALFKRIVDGRFARPSELDPAYPARLQEIVLAAIQPDPDRRCQSAWELHERLESLVADGPCRSTTRTLAAWVNQLCPEVQAEEEYDGEAAGVVVPAAEPTGATAVTASVNSGPSLASRRDVGVGVGVGVDDGRWSGRHMRAGMAVVGTLVAVVALSAVVAGRIGQSPQAVADHRRAQSRPATVPSSPAVPELTAAPGPWVPAMAPAMVGPPSGPDVSALVARRSQRPKRRAAARPDPGAARSAEAGAATGGVTAVGVPTAARASGDGVVYSQRPISPVPRPRLPRLSRIHGSDSARRTLAAVEQETLKAGCSPEFVRGITGALRRELLDQRSSELYPSAIYYFIVREAGLGRDRETAARALAAAHVSGAVKVLADLPVAEGGHLVSRY